MGEPEFSLSENIAKNLVFVDGLTRNGKSLFIGILPSLERMEHIQIFLILEQFLPAISLGTVDVSYAKVFMRLYLNEFVYNNRLSRNTNFRYSDHTGVINYPEPKLYYERLMREEGDSVVEELRKSDRMIPFKTHDLLVNLDILNKLGLDYRMLALFRHPVDNCYSWWTRGWGERFGVDPRAFTLCIEKNNHPAPWYCHGYIDRWISLNPMERCIVTATDLIERSVNQYERASGRERKRIHLLTFEEFTQNTDEELDNICRFLGTHRTIYTPQYLVKAGCPRVLNPEDRERKKQEFKAKVKKEIFDKLEAFSKSYEKNLYGLR